jgi:VWFA-related protein
MILEFNDSVRTICDLTRDKHRLFTSLDEIKPGEFTQVYEAVYTAVWEKFENVEGRKAVILFTDGIDTASSEITEGDTLDAIVETEDVIVYPIRYGTRRDVIRRTARRYKPDLDPNAPDPQAYIPEEVLRELDHTYRKADSYLQQLADLSGGVVGYADSLSDLNRAFQEIAAELRQQYLLGYYPTNANKAHANRRIKVEVRRRGYSVRARPAYSITQ